MLQKNAKNIHLFLFMTEGMSLTAWQEAGLLERELSLYKKIRPYVKKITIVSYGNKQDYTFAKELEGLDLICNSWNLPRKLYITLLPFICHFHAQGDLLFKSNQLPGADIALKVARKLNAKMIVRCGYPHSEFIERIHGTNSTQAQDARALERHVFQNADHCFVTTKTMKASLSQKNDIPPHKVSIVPNYVLTNTFTPTQKPASQRNKHIVFVGRFSPQKNLKSLLTALEGLDFHLHLVGEGELREELEQLSKNLNLAVTFHGRVTHNNILPILRQAEVFILPSLYEGHPKSLMEAMSAGMCVIASDVVGNNEVVYNGISGVLTGTDAKEIRKSLVSLYRDPSLMKKLASNARKQILEENCVDIVFRKEISLYEKIYDF